MNAANLIAWLVCLALAFFASTLAILNRGRTIEISRQLQRVEKQQTATTEQTEVLRRLETLLSRMQEAEKSGGEAAGGQ